MSPFIRMVSLTLVCAILLVVSAPARGEAQANEPEPLSLPDLIRLTLERNPRLAQAAFAIEVARGRAVQAGLYPNPEVRVSGDELGDRTGPSGIWTAPYVSQEIVTAKKLRLSQAAARREVDQATWALLAERYGRFAAVRQSYFELLTLQRRIDILRQLVKLAEQSVDTTRKLIEAKQPVAKLDLLQLEVELERYRAEYEAAEREKPAAFRRLAASVGVQGLPQTCIVGSLEIPVPAYDLEAARLLLLETHPEIQFARLGIDRAQLLLRRAQVEPVPNVTVGVGYVNQGQNRSNDVSVGVSLPVPVWNRNQGGIAAAQAHIGEAIQLLGRVENELVEKLADSFRTYASARLRAERYRDSILPKARETFELSLKAFKGGAALEYLRVLEAQRSVAQADLEYNRTLGELWRSASDIAALLLEEEWLAVPIPPVQLGPKPR